MFKRLYLGTILCGVSLGFFGAELRQLHHQARAIFKLETHGFGFLFQDAQTAPRWITNQLGEMYRKRAVVAWCDNPCLANRDLRLLRNAPFLSCLNLSGTRIDNDCYSVVAEMKQLRYLALHGTKVTPYGVSRIRNCLPECEVAWEARLSKVERESMCGPLRFYVPVVWHLSGGC